MAPSDLVQAFSDWVAKRNDSRLTMEHPFPNYRLRFNRRELLFLYEASDWVYAIFKTLAATEDADLRRRLSDPDSLHETVKYWGCRIHSPEDVGAVTRVLEGRIATGTW